MSSRNELNNEDQMQQSSMKNSDFINLQQKNKEIYLKDFLREEITQKYLNPDYTYIQYIGDFKIGLQLYDSEKLENQYDVLLDLDFLSYIHISEKNSIKGESQTILQLYNSQLWIQLDNTEFIYLHSIIPDSAEYFYAYDEIFSYLPSVIFFNDTEDLQKDNVYLTFALDPKKAQKSEKNQVINKIQNLKMFKSLQENSQSQIQDKKIENLNPEQQQLIQILKLANKIHLTIFNPPSFVTPRAYSKVMNSIFMQNLLNSNVYTIKLLLHDNLNPYPGIFVLLSLFAGNTYTGGNTTSINLAKGKNLEISQLLKHKRIAILKDQSYGQDPNCIFKYHANLITWIQEQRNFFFKTISAVRDYYKCVEFKPPYIQNLDLTQDIAKQPSFLFAFLEVKRSYKAFNLILASKGSFEYYDEIFKKQCYRDQYYQMLRELPGEVTYYIINSRKNIQHQLFLTDTEIYAEQGVYEKTMSQIYEQKQDFHSFMGYIINNFFIFNNVTNERLYVEKVQKSVSYFVQQFLLYCLSISFVLILQTFVPLIKYFLYRNKPYYMSQYVNCWFEFRNVKRDNLKKYLIRTTIYAALLHILFIFLNIFTFIATLQIIDTIASLKYDIFLLLLTHGEVIYCAGVAVLNVFIFTVVFQIQEENIQLHNQNFMNDLGISKENFYIEFMQDFQDEHLDYNIPELLDNQYTKSLYNIHTSGYINNSLKLGKQWISITQLMIFFAQRGNILTQNQNYLKIYKDFIKKGMTSTKGKLLIGIVVVTMLARIFGLIALRLYYGFKNDYLLLGYSFITINVYVFFAYQVLFTKFWIQRNKRRMIQRVLSMIKPRFMDADIPDVYNIASETPVINVACINSWTQWINYYSLTQYIIRIDEAYFDINDTLNILIFVVYGTIIFLDVFGFVWQKLYIISNQGFMIIVALDLFMAFFLICMNLYYKVKRNSSFQIFEKTVKQHLQYIKTFFANIDILYQECIPLNDNKDNNSQKDKQQNNLQYIKQQLQRKQNIPKIKQNHTNQDSQQKANLDINQILENYIQNDDKNENEQNNMDQDRVDKEKLEKIILQQEAFENIICEYSYDKQYTSDDQMPFVSHAQNIQKQYMIKIIREVCIEKNLKAQDESQYISLNQVELLDVKHHILKLKEKLEYVSEKLLIDKEKNQAKFLGLIVLDQKLLSSIIASSVIAIGGLLAQIIASEIQNQQ